MLTNKIKKIHFNIVENRTCDKSGAFLNCERIASIECPFNFLRSSIACRARAKPKWRLHHFVNWYRDQGQMCNIDGDFFHNCRDGPNELTQTSRWFSPQPFRALELCILLLMNYFLRCSVAGSRCHLVRVHLQTTFIQQLINIEMVLITQLFRVLSISLKRIPYA